MTRFLPVSGTCFLAWVALAGDSVPKPEVQTAARPAVTAALVAAVYDVGTGKVSFLKD